MFFVSKITPDIDPGRVLVWTGEETFSHQIFIAEICDIKMTMPRIGLGQMILQPM